jgi:hypothetical protein
MANKYTLYLLNNVYAEALTTGRLTPSGTNSYTQLKLNMYTATDNRLSSKGQPFVCVSKTTDSEFIKKKPLFFSSGKLFS